MRQSMRLVALRSLSLALALLLVWALPAWASPPLGALTIPGTRVPDWYMPPDPPDTSTWTVVPVHAANCDGSSGTNDRTAIENVLGSASPNTIVQLDGTIGSPCIYNITSGNMAIETSNVVLRGGGVGATILHLHSAGANIRIDGQANADGAPTNWTAGYTRGTTTVTVASTSGISAGDWVYLWAAFPAELNVGNDCSPANVNSATNMAIDKVASVGSGTLTLERPLRNDFSNAATCQQTVTKYNPVSHSGIESMTMVIVDPADSGWYYHPPVTIFNAVESWFKDVKMIGGQGPTSTLGLNVFVLVNKSSRFLIQRGWFDSIYFWPYNEAGIQLGTRTYDSAVIDSIFEGNHLDVKFEGGTQGAIAAYNFSRCYPATNCAERSIMMHGLANETLTEGNDLEVSTQHDTFWGPQQYRNTLYRNRVTTNPAHRTLSYVLTNNIVGISSYCNGSTYPMAPLTNIMLNVASKFRDDGNSNFDCRAKTPPPYSDYWIERNLVEGLMKLVPQSDTRDVSNVTSATTTQGVGDWSTKTYPASLVYTSKPSWWLSAPWPAIGADVDVIGSDMHKLPAQCRYEASTSGDCAPYEAPPSTPAPTHCCRRM